MTCSAKLRSPMLIAIIEKGQRNYKKEMLLSNLGVLR